jgi:hypothetical protein
MKRIIHLALWIFVLLLAFSPEAEAQRNKKKKSSVDKYFDESGNFTSRLWYGGGFNLGFSGNNNESIFQLGVSPIVGYKITENFSVGPRLSVLYLLYRAETFTPAGIQSANLFNYGLGAFGRFKFARTIFAHVEYGFDNEVVDLFYNPSSNDWSFGRRLRNNALVGVGYNDSAGGVWGYEIYLLYNLIQDNSVIDLPIDLRFGVTYNF